MKKFYFLPSSKAKEELKVGHVWRINSFFKQVCWCLFISMGLLMSADLTAQTGDGSCGTSGFWQISEGTATTDLGNGVFARVTTTDRNGFSTDNFNSFGGGF